MSAYDFLTFYYPKFSELSLERIQEMREAASVLIREGSPEVDTGPNSPFGDLFVSPAAPGMAGSEVAWNRLLSDLNPENVEKGIAYNCDFLRQFYLNLGIQDEETQRSYGLLRLVFSSSVERELDRSTTFLVNEGSYRPFAPFAGPIRLLPPGESGTVGENFLNYAFYGVESWAVDILVFGEAGQTPAAAGAAVEIDRTLPGLAAGVTLSEFRGGTTPVRLQDLARRARHNFYSRTPTTRGGATNLIHQQFPEMTLTGCTVSGDPEQVRDVVNPAQVAAGYLDLMVRTETLQEDTVTVRVRQAVDGEGETIYWGWMDLPEIPILILSMTNNGREQVRTLYSVSTDPHAPGLSAAYGPSERLLLKIPYTETSGVPNVRVQLDEEGVYADIVVRYLFDPNLKICQEFMRSDENIPAGLRLYTRWFVPVYVESLEVVFNRKAGVALNLETARADILSAFNSHRFEQPASAAMIDAALYYAGAHSVRSVSLAAEVRYSVATRVWSGTTFEEPTDQAGWEDFEAACLDVPEKSINTIYAPDFDLIDTEVPSTYAASGDRNVSYVLSSSNLKLTEYRSV